MAEQTGKKTGTDAAEQAQAPSNGRVAELEKTLEAIGKSQAVIEFNMDGTIITANDNFLSVVGYTLGEIQGQHHSMFVEPDYKNSAEYKQFWEALNRGEYKAAEYKRLGKGGKEVWIQASYNPILDLNGKPFKVVKFATDVTEQKLQNADYQGQIAAIGKSQAVIEFNMDGTIITANDNFLSVVGYTLGEIQGQHHSMFVEPEFKNSAEYKLFWEALNRGEYQAAEYKRLGKGGKEVWIQASYNPIFDLNGKPFKVVKYATDVTEQKLEQIEQKETQEEVARLIEAAQNGNLQERAEIGDAQGDYKALREGINEMLDSIVGPISEAAEVLSAAAQQDLTKRVVGDYKGDLNELKNDINGCIERLDDALMQVSQATDQVSSAAGQISTGSQSLAEGSSEQASSLEEISSSLEEMASMTKQNAESSSQAKGLAQGSIEAAAKGTESMERMTGAIDKIKESSGETSKIIKTIDEIAFQTNLLALNAAVEAARAGEAGKGFAVVAEEVRNLAQRSKEAAQTTSDMIEGSIKNAEEGVKVTEEVATILGEIAGGAEKMNSLVAEIAAASNEQAEGIEQVNTAVAQMDKVTQQNAANAEESASAAEELNGQSEELLSMVGAFMLTNGGAQAKAAPVKKLQAGRGNGLQKRVRTALHKGGPVATQNGNGKGIRPEAPKVTIPLDDDEDFGDF